MFVFCIEQNEDKLYHKCKDAIKVEDTVDAEICDVVVDNVNNDAKLTILLFEHVEDTSDDGDILDIRLTILLFEKFSNDT